MSMSFGRLNIVYVHIVWKTPKSYALREINQSASYIVPRGEFETFGRDFPPILAASLRKLDHFHPSLWRSQNQFIISFSSSSTYSLCSEWCISRSHRFILYENFDNLDHEAPVSLEWSSLSLSFDWGVGFCNLFRYRRSLPYQKDLSFL